MNKLSSEMPIVHGHPVGEPGVFLVWAPVRMVSSHVEKYVKHGNRDAIHGAIISAEREVHEAIVEAVIRWHRDRGGV